MRPDEESRYLDIVEQVARARRSRVEARRLGIDAWKPINVPPETGRLSPPAWVRKVAYDRSKLSELSSPDLFRLVEERMWTDLEFVTDCWTMLTTEGRRKRRKRLNRQLASNGIKRIPWLDEARHAIRELPAAKPGDHHVYAILLGHRGPQKSDYGIYVGESSKSPEERLMQHLCRTRNLKGTKHLAGRETKSQGMELLPTVVAPFANLDRSLAKEVEREVAAALRGLGIPVAGGT